MNPWESRFAVSTSHTGLQYVRHSRLSFSNKAEFILASQQNTRINTRPFCRLTRIALLMAGFGGFEELQGQTCDWDSVDGVCKREWGPMDMTWVEKTLVIQSGLKLDEEKQRNRESFLTRTGLFDFEFLLRSLMEKQQKQRRQGSRVWC